MFLTLLLCQTYADHDYLQQLGPHALLRYVELGLVVLMSKWLFTNVMTSDAERNGHVADIDGDGVADVAADYGFCRDWCVQLTEM